MSTGARIGQVICLALGSIAVLIGLTCSIFAITAVATGRCDRESGVYLTKCYDRQQILVQASVAQAVLGGGLLAASAGFYVGGRLGASRRGELAAPPLTVAVDAAQTLPVSLR